MWQTNSWLVQSVSFAGLGAGSPCVGTCVCVLAPLSLSLRQNMTTTWGGKWFCLGHTGRSPQPRINPVLVQVVPLEVVARGLRKTAWTCTWRMQWTLHTRRQSDILHIPTWPRQVDKTVKEKHEERKSITQTKNSSKHRKIFFYFLSTFFKIFKAEIEVTPCAGMLAMEKVVLEARQFQKHLIRYVQGWRVIFSPSHSHCRIVFLFPWMYLDT